MDKHCKDCNNKLVIGNNWTEARKKAYIYVCKACKILRYKKHYDKNKEHYFTYHKQYKESKKDGNQHVYILAKENYAGVTCNLYFRMGNHKSQGRYIDDMRIIYSTSDREEALELESLLHDIGYKGRHLGRYRSFK